jgi:prevent-host-death family protein
MATVALSQLRANLGDLTNKVAYAGERLCIERNGKPFVALVSLDDMELLEQLEDRMDLELAKAALKRNDFVSWEKVKKELGL